jgi:hypothetical protein
MADIDGDSGNNPLSGTNGSDRIRGFAGNDTLEGLGGADRLEGGAGRDVLRGGSGRDILMGGLGRDLMYGGPGNDTFAFDDRDAGDATAGPQSDVIFDFSAGDVLDLMAVDILNVDYYGRNPERGAASIWQANGNTYVTWNTFGTFHDVELRGFTGDPYSQIRWYQDDYLANTSTSGRVSLTHTAAGNIEVAPDTDWIRATLQQGHAYRFDVQDAQDGSGTLPEAYVQIRNAQGEGLVWGYESVSLSVTQPGFYYVEVGDFGATGTYSLAMTELEDDYAGDASTTGRVAVGGAVNGDLEASFDHDWFRVRLVDGRTYAIDLKGADSDSGSLGDPYLRLYSEGTVVAENDDSDTYDSHIEFTATRTGYYYADAGGFDTSSGTYELSVTRIDDLAV